MKQYTEKEREILKKLYKGPKYWTVTGTLKYETPGLPGDEFKEVTLKKYIGQRWPLMARRGLWAFISKRHPLKIVAIGFLIMIFRYGRNCQIR
jgi:hypothetical protein